VRQFKAFCQFENRYIRDIGIILVPEDFFQKQDVLEYSPCHRFLATPSHKNLLINIDQKKEMRSAVTDERRVGIIAVHHPTTSMTAITEISKAARLGANNMPTIEKAVILTEPEL
jgi:hypothetical protein